MTTDFDTIIVGAGVVGLAIARQLALGRQKVLVVEKASRAGVETSSRNSEVIHAGIYYPNDSQKARLCVEAFNTAFESAIYEHKCFVVKTTDIGGEVSEVTSRTLVNCAGHGAHDVAISVKDFPHEKCPPRYFAKGSYCSVSGITRSRI